MTGTIPETRPEEEVESIEIRRSRRFRVAVSHEADPLRIIHMISNAHVCSTDERVIGLAPRISGLRGDVVLELFPLPERYQQPSDEIPDSVYSSLGLRRADALLLALMNRAYPLLTRTMPHIIRWRDDRLGLCFLSFEYSAGEVVVASGPISHGFPTEPCWWSVGVVTE